MPLGFIRSAREPNKKTILLENDDDMKFLGHKKFVHE